MKDKLTVSIHIDGNKVETLTDEQLSKYSRVLGEVMSSYYSSHMEEYKQWRP